MTREEKGEPQWSLRAAMAVLQEAGGQAVLTSPRVEIFKKGRPATAVSAKSGLLRTLSQDMTLTGEVVVASREDRSTLKTDSLDYESAKRRFKTDRPVLIERPGSRMRGKGLVAKEDLSEIQILEQEARSY